MRGSWLAVAASWGEKGVGRVRLLMARLRVRGNFVELGQGRVATI